MIVMEPHAKKCYRRLCDDEYPCFFVCLEQRAKNGQLSSAPCIRLVHIAVQLLHRLLNGIAQCIKVREINVSIFCSFIHVHLVIDHWI